MELDQLKATGAFCNIILIVLETVGYTKVNNNTFRSHRDYIALLIGEPLFRRVIYYNIITSL